MHTYFLHRMVYPQPTKYKQKNVVNQKTLCLNMNLFIDSCVILDLLNLLRDLFWL